MELAFQIQAETPVLSLVVVATDYLISESIAFLLQLFFSQINVVEIRKADGMCDFVGIARC